MLLQFQTGALSFVSISFLHAAVLEMHRLSEFTLTGPQHLAKTKKIWVGRDNAWMKLTTGSKKFQHFK